MKYIPFFFLILAFALPAVAEQTLNHPPMDHKKVTEGMGNQELPVTDSDKHAKVLSTIPIDNTYLYLEVDPDDSDENLWIAIPAEIKVEKGDTIRYQDGPMMYNFTSRTLDRTFESVMFLSTVAVE